MGFGLVTGLMEHLQLITTSNYNGVTERHTLQIATASTTHCLVMAPNSGYSLASIPTPLLDGNWLTSLSTATHDHLAIHTC
jgi:hypothetical protein